MDVFVTRLEQEYNKSVIVTTPNVPYKVKIVGAKNIKAYHGDEVTVLNPCHVRILTLKALSEFCRLHSDFFNFFFIIFKENKTWHFI